MVKTPPSQSKPSTDSLQHGPPAPPACPSFSFHLDFHSYNRQNGLAVVHPGSAARCCFGENPSAATYLAPECFSFLLFKVVIVISVRLVAWQCGRGTQVEKKLALGKCSLDVCVTIMLRDTPEDLRSQRFYLSLATRPLAEKEQCVAGICERTWTSFLLPWISLSQISSLCLECHNV